MGNQCYYYGVDKKDEQLVELLVERLMKEEEAIGYYGKVIFKKPIELDRCMWDKKAEPEHLEWKENETFFVLQGDRYEANQFVDKLTVVLEHLNITMRLVPLDNINTQLFMPEFRDFCRKDQSKATRFENKYVVITV